MKDKRKDEGKDKDRLQGEGDREAARHYRKDTEDYLESHDVESDAQHAEPESRATKEALRKAEEEGRKHAREEDPAVRRDYSDSAGD